MTSFDFLWILLESHGVVASYKAECARVWNEYSLQQQREIYRSIRDKLRAGKFVNYNPVKAVKENASKAPRTQTLTFKEYYARYGTTLEQDGWRMTNPTGQQVIYVKN
jgi:hypothetical protein